jgi:monoamine oxidase
MAGTTTYPHVPIEEQLARIKAADKGPRRHFWIVGAGIAGRGAAWVLRGLGHTVTILEASERVGGRIFTYRFGPESDELYGELGAMRIPASHDYTLYFIGRMGLTLRPFITVLANGKAFLDLRGKVARIEDGQAEVYPLYELSDWERTQYPGAAIFGMGLEALIGLMTPNEVVSLFAGKTDTPMLQWLDGMSLGDFLRQRGQAAGSAELMGSFTSLDGWQDKSITMFLRDTIVDTSDGLQEIVGGADLLPRKLAETMTDSIRLRSPVHGIEAGTDGVRLGVSLGQGSENIAASQVLVTVPFTVLRRMEVSGFSDEKMTSIRNLNYASATKIILNVKERFWETKYGIFGGASLSDRITRQTYYPSDHADQNAVLTSSPGKPRGVAGIAMQHHTIAKAPEKEAGGPGVLLASYTLGQDAIKLGALPVEDRATVAIENISRFHPEIKEPGMVLGHASMAWDQHKWAGGAFSFLWPSQLGRLYQAGIRPEQGVHFAGEHLSTDQAWIQGALISALRAVEEMVAAY